MQKANEKAEALHMTNSVFSTPSGIGDITYNVTTARDLMKLAVAVSKNEFLDKIWHAKEKQLQIAGKHPRTLPIYSTLNNPEVNSSYSLLAGKTGTWGNTCHMVAFTEINGIRILGVILSSFSNENRFKAMDMLFNISEKLINNPKLDIKKNYVSFSEAAISCIITDDDYQILYEQNADQKHLAASLTKILTALTALDYIEKLDDMLSIKSSDLIHDLNVHFQNGDKLTFEDVFYAMLLPSSNQVATALARTLGKL